MESKLERQSHKSHFVRPCAPPRVLHETIDLPHAIWKHGESNPDFTQPATQMMMIAKPYISNHRPYPAMPFNARILRRHPEREIEARN